MCKHAYGPAKEGWNHFDCAYTSGSMEFVGHTTDSILVVCHHKWTGVHAGICPFKQAGVCAGISLYKQVGVRSAKEPAILLAI